MRLRQLETDDDFRETGKDALHLLDSGTTAQLRLRDGNEKIRHFQVVVTTLTRCRSDNDPPPRVVGDDGADLLDELSGGERTAAKLGNADGFHEMLQFEHVCEVPPVPAAQLLNVVVCRRRVRAAASQPGAEEPGGATANAVDGRIGKTVGHQVGGHVVV